MTWYSDTASVGLDSCKKNIGNSSYRQYKHTLLFAALLLRYRVHNGNEEEQMLVVRVE